MQISLNNAGKRFNREWIFRDFTYTFKPGKAYAITGPNGSGKSTLLQVLAASMNPSEGIIKYEQNNKEILNENVYQHISLAAPYLEVIEEMTAKEFLEFHKTFKPFISAVTIKDILLIIGLEKSADKQIRFYSSGMKQRIKLAQAIFSDVPSIFLDEPCTNLDETGYKLYHELIENYCTGKLVIVSSNDINEYDFCEERVNILNWK